MAVTGKVGEADTVRIDGADEAARAAAMLRIGLSCRIGGDENGGVDLGEKGHEFGIDVVRKPPDASTRA